MLLSGDHIPEEKIGVLLLVKAAGAGCPSFEVLLNSHEVADFLEADGLLLC